jgi:uncharacterized membrane protein (UPF0182 family)
MSGKSRAAALPELKRVIVAFAGRVAMAENLDNALSSVFEGAVTPGEATVRSATKILQSSHLGVRALDHYKRAKAFLKKGDWAGYGAELNQLEALLEKMAQETK